MNEYEKKFEALLKDNPHMLKRALFSVSTATLSQNLEQATDNIAIWKEIFQINLASYLVQHLSDHKCDDCPRMLDVILTDIDKEVRKIVQDGCEQLGLHNPFTKLTHNEKLAKELLKEHQNG